MDGIIDIGDIIKKKSINTQFLPIICPENRKIKGVEALTRGIASSGVIAPSLLFDRGETENLILELDKVCRENAISEFKNSYMDHAEMLFINFNLTNLDKIGVVGAEHLEYLVKKAGIKPENICVEFVENSVKNTSNLQKFVNIYRKFGFKIGIDNVGKFSFNKERLLIIKPDILKVDRTVINDISKSIFKQETFKSIISTAKRIGADVIAQGVETDDDCVIALSLGADYLQGFYFGEPKLEPDLKKIELKTTHLFHLYMGLVQKKYEITNAYYKVYQEVLVEIIKETKQTGIEKINEYVTKYFDAGGTIKNIYVLNKDGILECDGIWNAVISKDINGKYKVKGECCVFHDYYANAISKKGEIVLSEMYIAQYDKKLTKTISAAIENTDGEVAVLCIDISLENIRSSSGTGLMISNCI